MTGTIIRLQKIVTGLLLTAFAAVLDTAMEDQNLNLSMSTSTGNFKTITLMHPFFQNSITISSDSQLRKTANYISNKSYHCGS
ncbi:hypothetical protein M758_7G143400 [Ceratodon purpureus]|nr:hypothetical protein M758_7G143400 [Ceratodon purpureus]